MLNYLIAIVIGINSAGHTKPHDVRIINEEVYCLAQNIYFEAGNQPFAGKVAVGEVTIQRVHDSRYPNNICGVVYEGPLTESWKTRQHDNLSDQDRIYYPKRHKCQFSWYCDGKSDEIKYRQTWETSILAAQQALHNQLSRTLTEGATHYHATYVNPSWAKKIDFIIQIGDHRFYKYPNK